MCFYVSFNHQNVCFWRQKIINMTVSDIFLKQNQIVISIIATVVSDRHLLHLCTSNLQQME